jgi:crossover junction endodeoxyribonuclease RusA
MTIPLPTESDPPGYYRLEIPAYPGWLTLNGRPHWAVKARVTKTYRALAHTQSMMAKLPRIERAYVIAELFFATNRRRDPHNWMPTAKAIVDGMVDAGVFPDDSTEHVTGPDMRIGPVTRNEPEKIVMHVWPQADPVFPTVM